MNKSVIKNFAVTARIKLMEAIEQKAYELGITKKEIKEPEVYKEGFRVNDKFFKNYQMKQREKLLQKIKDQGFEQVIEEVAYTWFNRFIAIRFMEVNEYLPTGVRVLSSIDSRKVEPDAVSDVLTIADELELDLDIVYRMQDENNSDELSKYILVKQCNKLGEILPMMFEQIEDYTELLLPDKLLSEGSVVRDLISMIDEEDWKEQVEIIGWLYQHYISEKKEEVDKKKGRVLKEDLPAKTQLFTPKWIVKYMLENSLGRLGIKTLQNDELKKEFHYYLEDQEFKENTVEQINHQKALLNPEEIKIIDPSMGSGHILVYAFDVLFKIYKNVGYSERKIPQLILEKNLYGLDIDDRAAQLAYFSVLMKARKYDRKILSKKIDVNITSIHDVDNLIEEALDYFANQIDSPLASPSLQENLNYIKSIYKNAKEYGSVLNIDKIDTNKMLEKFNELSNTDSGDLFAEQFKTLLKEKFPNLLKQTFILSNQYDVVCTNPPYLGSGKISENLSKFIAKYYPNSKRDLYSVFIEKCISLTKENGYTAMITQEPWMFASAFENFRLNILLKSKVVNMLHLGSRTFEEISGEVVKSTAFVLKNQEPGKKHFPLFVDLTNLDTKGKENGLFNKELWYNSLPQDLFTKIPKYPICYWANKETLEIFKEKNTLPFKAGRSLQTGNDPLFIRYWHEVDLRSIALKDKDKNAKWFLFNKGGPYRKWFGNNEYILLWENDGERIKKMHQEGEIKATLRNLNVFFKEGITYTYITSGDFSARYSNSQFTYSGAGPAVHSKNPYYLLGFLNSKVFNYLVRLFKGETERYESGDVESIPLLELEEKSLKNEIIQLVKEAIQISMDDWNDRESSYEFKKHPLLEKKKNLVAESFEQYVNVQKMRIKNLIQIEERINQIFIKRYSLEGILNPSVKEDKISLKIEDKLTLIKSLFSYAVGCMFGRYSLDQDGIVFAGGEFDASNYNTFKADFDNIIPITDDEFFEDDIVSRFVSFIRITFGQETLEENLEFIAKVLIKKENETARQRIRRYFVKEFYKDHLQTYQRTPIYWLFDSGKNDGFKALVYLHRQEVGTVARVRTDYLHTLQRKYEAEISRLDLTIESNVSSQEKTKAKKLKDKIQIQLLECQQYDQVIAHIANQKVNVDLDVGVKVNYEKFQNIEVPQGEGKKPLKANLLSNI